MLTRRQKSLIAHLSSAGASAELAVPIAARTPAPPRTPEPPPAKEFWGDRLIRVVARQANKIDALEARIAKLEAAPAARRRKT